MAYVELDKEALSKAGFTDVIEPRQGSTVISLAGLEGTGKTTWALTAPKPLFYQGTDFGTDGVIQKANGQIIRPTAGDYKLNIPFEYRAFVDRKETDKERQMREGRLANYVHEQFYVPFYEDFIKAIDTGARSIVWDSASEIWEFIRLSVFGRTGTNRPDLNAEANAKFRELVRTANVRNVNLIMINHLKKQWDSYFDAQGNVKWRPTADWTMEGNDKCPRLVAINLWTEFTPGDALTNTKPKFDLKIKKNRDRAEYVGQTFPALPFLELMGLLVPDVDSWE